MHTHDTLPTLWRETGDRVTERSRGEGSEGRGYETVQCIIIISFSIGLTYGGGAGNFRILFSSGNARGSDDRGGGGGVGRDDFGR